MTGPTGRPAHNRIDLTGKRFVRLLVVQSLGRGFYICRCDCGTERRVQAANLRSGSTQSCGCLRKTQLITHGQGGTKLHMVWGSMVQRCTNPNNRSFANYGGRGITVCERWRNSFEAFRDDMGPRPEGGTVERIDNDRGYEPSNCRWASRVEQSRNRRGRRILEHAGERLLITEWGRRLGCDWRVIRDRIEAGWSVERAVTTPARKMKRRPEWTARRIEG